jgi:hypothetical protein
MLNLRRLPFVLCALAVLSVSLILIQRRPGNVAGRDVAARPVLASSQSQLSPSTVPPEFRAHVAENYGKLPLNFEANNGQSDKQVKFLSRGQGYALFLTRDEAVLSLQRSSKKMADRHSIGMDPVAFQTGKG